MRELFSKLWSGRGSVDRELREEIEAHIQLRADESAANGMSAEDAQAEARRHFGNAVLTHEGAAEAWRFPRIESVYQDLKYGIRGAWKSPGFALAVILTLALGIGANTAIFSVVYNVLLRPLPYPGSERIVSLREIADKASGVSVTWINYQHWRAENHTFEEMAALTQSDFTMTGRGEAQITHAALVTPSFFSLTGSHTQFGRLFGEGDDRVGASGVAVLTWEFWNKSFGADPKVIGTTLDLNGKPYEVIGVLNPQVRAITNRADYYLPLGPSAGRTTNRSAHGSIGVMGRLKPGVSLAAARANIDEIMQRLGLSDPGPEASHRASAEFLTESISGGVRQTLMVLMSAAGLLLFIACANVASLLLVRGAARTREIAIRTAIGAGRTRVARQLLTENLAISAIGGAVGLVFALGNLRALIALAPRNLPRVAEITLNVPVLCFAAAATILTGIVVAIAPVFASARVDVSNALKDGAAGAGRALRGQRFRSALVVGEIAITLVLSFGSGVLIRSLIAAQNIDPGFDTRNLLALELQLPSSTYKSDEQVRQFFSSLADQLRREPGVLDAGAVTCPPGAGDCGDWWYSPMDRPAPAKPDVPLTLFLSADPEYFKTMGIRIVAGRAFANSDRAGAPPVMIINEEIARKWWKTPQEAIGKQIKFGGPYMEGNAMEIAGVAHDVRQMGLDGESVPQMYFPLAQEGSRSMTVMVRTRGNASALMPSMRRAVASLDRNLPVKSLKLYEATLGATLARRRFTTLLLTVFAGLAMFLAGVGIYGVLNYWVSVRTREIAVRMALGAPRPAILQWAGGSALRLAVCGILLGGIGAWMGSRWLKSLVFGVSAQSPATMALAACTVLCLAAIASGLPVWRATRVDVTRNLRDS